jgi:predicted RNase H-like nuclease
MRVTGVDACRGGWVADTLDAAAVAWSARRIAAGEAAVLPDPPQRDERGGEIAIRY